MFKKKKKGASTNASSNQIIGNQIDNKIVGNIKLENSTIDFGKGTGNIVYCASNILIKNSKIKFFGNNSLLYIKGNDKKELNICADLYNNNTLHIGKNISINKSLRIIISEETSVFIGDDTLFSLGITLRTADPHLIYSSETHKRLNYSKSIFFGDHVWVGQESIILKNSIIGSGAIIGAHSVVSGKTIGSNTSWAGNPVRKIKSNLFFIKERVHNYTQKETQNSEQYLSDQFIYQKDSNLIDPQEIFKFLNDEKDVCKKIDYLKNLKQTKNRFFVD